MLAIPFCLGGQSSTTEETNTATAKPAKKRYQHSQFWYWSDLFCILPV